MGVGQPNRRGTVPYAKCTKAYICVVLVEDSALAVRVMQDIVAESDDVELAELEKEAVVVHAGPVVVAVVPTALLCIFFFLDGLPTLDLDISHTDIANNWRHVRIAAIGESPLCVAGLPVHVRVVPRDCKVESERSSTV